MSTFLYAEGNNLNPRVLVSIEILEYFKEGVKNNLLFVFPIISEKPRKI